MLQNKAIVYILIAVFSLSTLSTIVSNVKDYFKEPTYSKEAVELMLKHAKLKQDIEDLKIENKIIEKDNERLKQNITTDSTIIYNSSREYRDSLRAVLFAN
jgi:hypothetical protein